MAKQGIKRFFIAVASLLLIPAYAMAGQSNKKDADAIATCDDLLSEVFEARAFILQSQADAFFKKNMPLCSKGGATTQKQIANLRTMLKNTPQPQPLEATPDEYAQLGQHYLQASAAICHVYADANLKYASQLGAPYAIQDQAAFQKEADKRCSFAPDLKMASWGSIFYRIQINGLELLDGQPERSQAIWMGTIGKTTKALQPLCLAANETLLGLYKQTGQITSRKDEKEFRDNFNDRCSSPAVSNIWAVAADEIGFDKWVEAQRTKKESVPSLMVASPGGVK